MTLAYRYSGTQCRIFRPPEGEVTMTEQTVAEVESAIAVEPGAAVEEAVAEESLVDDLLVEEVSIDGMCGVY
jgi:mycofactocin precursor